jgi:hypothetical protein
MSLAQSLTARMIGTVFVQRGLLSESQIRVALEIQRETGQQLGQILVERFGVSRQELASVVAEQWADMGRSMPSATDAEANESWRRLGDIFVERGFVTPQQLEQALERQRETGERVGEALVAQGSISKFELAGALAEQMSVLAELESSASEAPEATVVELATRLEEPVASAEREAEPEPVASPAPEPVASVEPELVASVEPELVASVEPELVASVEPELVASVEPELVASVEPELVASPELEPMPAPVILPTSLPSLEPKSPFGWVAFASTTAGYRLVHLSGAIPMVGDTVEVPDVGALLVLRLGRSPLPGDQRTCVFLEQLIRPEPSLVV